METVGGKTGSKGTSQEATAIVLARGGGEPQVEEMRSGQVLDTFWWWADNSRFIFPQWFYKMLTNNAPTYEVLTTVQVFTEQLT